VAVDGATSDGFEAGLIQNMVKCNVKFRYSSGVNDSNPIVVTMVMNPLPVLDSKTTKSVWLTGQFRLLGTTRLPPGTVAPPGFSSISNLEASISGGDDPGGVFPLVNVKNPSKRLSQIDEELQFVTWLAVRKSQLQAASAASFQFLRHAVWSVKRQIAVHQDAAGRLLGAPLLKNETSLESFLTGQGSLTPVLSGPIANDAVKFI
jgi:hypothetical protein